jgi:hypothetical protein
MVASTGAGGSYSSIAATANGTPGLRRRGRLDHSLTQIHAPVAKAAVDQRLRHDPVRTAEVEHVVTRREPRAELDDQIGATRRVQGGSA